MVAILDLCKSHELPKLACLSGNRARLVQEHHLSAKKKIIILGYIGVPNSLLTDIRNEFRVKGQENKINIASAGNRTQINCLEGNHANLYTTDATCI